MQKGIEILRGWRANFKQLEEHSLMHTAIECGELNDTIQGALCDDLKVDNK